MTGVLQPGTAIAGYVIRSVIAKGGMGVVYLAHQERPNREVALKLMAPERASDPVYRERFLRESEILADLEHPNIVPIHAAGEWEGQLYLAMRYVRGESLAGRLERTGPLDPGQAIEVLTPIADALTSAHEGGVVHRDVKPANILISARGHVYLTDFGLTKRAGSDPGLTRPGTALGTEGYMAPEQFTGSVEPALATRIDVYALGCVLHACLTGVEPYPRDSYDASLWAHVFSPPPSLDERAPALTFLDPIIARAMAKEPAERYATANELIADLRRAVALAPTPETASGVTQTVVAPATQPVPNPPERRALSRTVVAAPSASVHAPTVAGASETPTRAPNTSSELARTDIVSQVDPARNARRGRYVGGWTIPTDLGIRGLLPLAAVGTVLGVLLLAAFVTGFGQSDEVPGGAAGGRQSATAQPSSTPRPPTPGPTASATPVDPADALAARVPAIVDGCSPAAGPSSAADVAIQCTAADSAGDISVQYAQFSDLATMVGAWGVFLAENGIPPGSGDCPATPGEHPWRHVSDPVDTERGRQLCYVSDGADSPIQAVIDWTAVDHLVWAIAWRDGSDLADLGAVVGRGALDIKAPGG